MPTYQYACTACEESLEVVQSFSDASLTECPSCGGRLRKKFGAVGVVFKGSGFYKTDSRSEKKTAAASSASSGDSGSTGSSTGSSTSSSAPAASTASTSASSSSSSSSSTSGSSTSAA